MVSSSSGLSRSTSDSGARGSCRAPVVDGGIRFGGWNQDAPLEAVAADSSRRGGLESCPKSSGHASPRRSTSNRRYASLSLRLSPSGQVRHIEIFCSSSFLSPCCSLWRLLLGGDDGSLCSRFSSSAPQRLALSSTQPPWWCWYTAKSCPSRPLRFTRPRCDSPVPAHRPVLPHYPRPREPRMGAARRCDGECGDADEHWNLDWVTHLLGTFLLVGLCLAVRWMDALESGE